MTKLKYLLLLTERERWSAGTSLFFLDFSQHTNILPQRQHMTCFYNFHNSILFITKCRLKKKKTRWFMENWVHRVLWTTKGSSRIIVKFGKSPTFNGICSRKFSFQIFLKWVDHSLFPIMQEFSPVQGRLNIFQKIPNKFNPGSEDTYNLCIEKQRSRKQVLIILMSDCLSSLWRSFNSDHGSLRSCETPFPPAVHCPL